MEQTKPIRCVAGLLAALLLLSSCSTINTEDSVASQQGSELYASVMTGVQIAPEDSDYSANYIQPAAPFATTIKPTSLEAGKQQLTRSLEQTPSRLSIDCSALSWSDKINLFQWVARTYAAIYDSTMPEFALPVWSAGIARWSAAVWKLNYYDLESWTNAGCPSILMTRLNYTQGWSFANGGGGPAFDEYCDKYLSNLDGMSDYQIAIYIMDLVCDQVEYDREAYESGSKYQLAQANDIKNYFVTNSMCCYGYARIYQALCLRAGLQCYEIIGNAGGCHAWNAVVVDGRLLQVDACWLDTGSEFKSVVAFGQLKNHYADVRYNGTLSFAV